jgi:hypothetical protein
MSPGFCERPMVPKRRNRVCSSHSRGDPGAGAIFNSTISTIPQNRILLPLPGIFVLSGTF